MNWNWSEASGLKNINALLKKKIIIWSETQIQQQHKQLMYTMPI